ncbi:MAG: zf-HC2 domain-containing protein [Actinomycetota bacterium]|nr:zf-HC2 domain-containing protein [Actinomycetota bacterium]
MSPWFRRSKRAEWLACQQLVELVTDYLEEALAPDLLEAFQEHISDCGNCAEYLRQMRRTIELERLAADEGVWVESSGPVTVAPPMLDELLVAFRAQHPH